MSSDDSDLDEDYKSKQITKMVLQKRVATTPISILIESLVKHLCTLIDNDDQRASKIYTQICTKFYEMKLIDESYNMTEFEGVRSQYQRALYHLVTATRGTDKPLQIQQIWSNESLYREFSHYYQQFEEVEFIADGGFGQVFKVRHKLDGTLYAVKKIFIRANGIKSVMEYISEVKTFAGLNHYNIVQYKAAWLELSVQSNKKAIEMSDNTFSEVSMDEKQIKSDHFRFTNHDSSEFTVQFESTNSKQNSHSVSNNNNATSEYFEQLENSEVFKIYTGDTRNSLSNPEYSTKYTRKSRNSISEGGKAICKFNFTEHLHNFALPERNWATLYIQMSLCQITLKQWLENRNQSEKDVESLIRLQSKARRNIIHEILCQILKGLEYIHSKRIVHHDVKPSNVFIQTDGGKLNVQLGDFGLACSLQTSRHSLAFGTKLYAAPEQLDGKCDPKSDLYSLGIILLELTDSYQTDMERVKHISDLRRGRLPAHISAADPSLAATISQLATGHPLDRPSAAELLARLTAASETEELQQLQTKLRETEKVVERLKAMLKEKGVDVE